MEEKLCSVIIPTYNCAGTIRQAVHSAQNQTYKNSEIFILDDGSTDETLRIAKALAKDDNRIRVFQNQQNLGVALTRNKGFDLAEGNFIAVLDSDDIWEPDKLQEQIALLEKTDCGFCYTSYSCVDSAGIVIGSEHIIPESCTFTDLLKENVICCSSVVLKKELIEKHKMSNDYFHEDFVFWLELLKDGYKACGCPQPLVKYRVSQHGRSHNKLSAAKNRWLVYRNYLHLPFFPSLYYFCVYAANGIKKYYKLK
jgi:teichuronic acid biosynthesis glycosyltransferase TuaG